jgi:hypothetical protein
MSLVRFEVWHGLAAIATAGGSCRILNSSSRLSFPMADARFHRSTAGDQVIEGVQKREACLAGSGGAFEIGCCAS